MCPLENIATPEQAVDRLEALYRDAIRSQSAALEKFAAGGEPPTAQERAGFRYPELRIIYRGALEPKSGVADRQRAYAKPQKPGIYRTTVTQPKAFRSYFLDMLTELVADYGVEIQVGLSEQEIPYPYTFEKGDQLFKGAEQGPEVSHYFPVPLLSSVGDEIADGEFQTSEEGPWPLSLFEAVRVDYSLSRLVHYTGSDWRSVQPWILLTNYHRYVDQFINWSLQQINEGLYDSLELPGGVIIDKDMDEKEAMKRAASSPWHRFQMPAYHLRKNGGAGLTLINIGVGPSNAKTITDHLAVLRPHCWLMIGHCGGLRQSQSIGDYVLAHGYLRRDHILDKAVPPDVPVPALAEVQVALQEAAAQITGERGEALKGRLRTGTVVTYDDRNWELRWSRERRQINLSRAIAVDMESGTIAAQGYRFRVPYGTLLCVSDKPLHGEIKLPGAANAFYERAVGEHLMIGIRALGIMQSQLTSLHSRKLRSFDEPLFR
ncbi:AMP nucleosidase [Microvirga sp. W0021]|uniref:AMP nucleosidase n=1 Tax=Hohaiivirga grylli TaxID=3133970 RepID=A0ABV0BJY8_9HYPH